MDRFHTLEKSNILKILHLLDNKLTDNFDVQLCGTAAVLLQDYNFRLTRDIDFTKSIGNIGVALIQRVYKDNPDLAKDTFDNQAPGVVCLLEDYEDRLVEIKDNFKYLRVYVISVVDWIVSKLEAPKFPDLYDYPEFIKEEYIEK